VAWCHPKALELREQVRDVVEQAALLFRSADSVDLGTLRRRFSIRANDFFIGVYGGKLFDTLDQQAPHCELRFVPEGDGDDEALREGRIDLSVSNTRPVTPEVKCRTCSPRISSVWCVRIIHCSTAKSPPSAMPVIRISACRAVALLAAPSTPR
jgi:DNA-binding transcriptional LysR family regulator